VPSSGFVLVTTPDTLELRTAPTQFRRGCRRFAPPNDNSSSADHCSTVLDVVYADAGGVSTTFPPFSHTRPPPTFSSDGFSAFPVCHTHRMRRVVKQEQRPPHHQLRPALRYFLRGRHALHVSNMDDTHTPGPHAFLMPAHTQPADFAWRYSGRWRSSTVVRMQPYLAFLLYSSLCARCTHT